METKKIMERKKEREKERKKESSIRSAWKKESKIYEWKQKK